MTGGLRPNITISEKDEHSLAFTWTRVENADGYDICLSRCNHDYKTVTPMKVKARSKSACKITA